MIARSKYRIDPYRSVKIPLRTAKVSEIVLCDTSEEVVPVICGIKLREDIEILDCLSIFAISQGPATAHIEGILVILGMHICRTCGNKHEEYDEIFNKSVHNVSFYG